MKYSVNKESRNYRRFIAVPLNTTLHHVRQTVAWAKATLTDTQVLQTFTLSWMHFIWATVCEHFSVSLCGFTHAQLEKQVKRKFQRCVTKEKKKNNNKKTALIPCWQNINSWVKSKRRNIYYWADVSKDFNTEKLPDFRLLIYTSIEGCHNMFAGG